MAECLVLPGLYGLLVQGLLFLCVVMTLVFKKIREGAERTWWEFGLDSSKQLLGSGCLHVLNLACASWMSPLEGGDECEWYWINIMVDDTLGILVMYRLLKLFTFTVTSWLSPERAAEYQSGEYYADGAFQSRRYAKQLTVWLSIVATMKLGMVLFSLVLNRLLLAVARWMLRPFLASPALKLLVVMIATPLFMNALQVWIVDSFIRRPQARRPLAHQDQHDGDIAVGQAHC